MDYLMKFFSKMIIFRGNSMWGIDCAHPRTVKTLPWPWFREGIGVLKRNQFWFFSWSQRSVFTVRECAQSIPRIKVPLEGHLLKNFLPGPKLDPLLIFFRIQCLSSVGLYSGWAKFILESIPERIFSKPE